MKKTIIILSSAYMAFAALSVCAKPVLAADQVIEQTTVDRVNADYNQESVHNLQVTGGQSVGAVSTTTALEVTGDSSGVADFKKSDGSTALEIKDGYILSHLPVVIAHDAPTAGLTGTNFTTGLSNYSTAYTQYGILTNQNSGGNQGPFLQPGGAVPPGLRTIPGNAIANALAGTANGTGAAAFNIGNTLTLSSCWCYIINYNIDAYVRPGGGVTNDTAFYWWLTYSGTNTEPWLAYPRNGWPYFNETADPAFTTPILRKWHFKKILCNIDNTDQTIQARGFVRTMSASGITPDTGGNPDTTPLNWTPNTPAAARVFYDADAIQLERAQAGSGVCT